MISSVPRICFAADVGSRGTVALALPKNPLDPHPPPVVFLPHELKNRQQTDFSSPFPHRLGFFGLLR